MQWRVPDRWEGTKKKGWWARRAGFVEGTGRGFSAGACSGLERLEAVGGLLDGSEAGPPTGGSALLVAGALQCFRKQGTPSSRLSLSAIVSIPSIRVFVA